MKRLIKRANFTENQVRDAVNKGKHYKETMQDAVQNAQDILGQKEADAYLMAVILRYNGEEQELDTQVNAFLYSGVLEPTIYTSAQELMSSWESYLDEF